MFSGNILPDMSSSKPGYIENYFRCENMVSRLKFGPPKICFSILITKPFGNITQLRGFSRQMLWFIRQKQRISSSSPALPRQNGSFFLRENFPALAQEHGTRLLLLHLPSSNEDISRVIKEREYWPGCFGRPRCNGWNSDSGVVFGIEYKTKSSCYTVTAGTLIRTGRSISHPLSLPGYCKSMRPKSNLELAIYLVFFIGSMIALTLIALSPESFLSSKVVYEGF